MPKRSIEDIRYEAIKAHCINPENSPLKDEYKKILDRWISASKILDKNPIQKQAAALHMAKYPEISRTQAYNDIRNSMRLFNSVHTFDYDWWHSWLLKDIVELIQESKQSKDLKSWAMAQGNLIKALGDKPEKLPDPRLVEKHDIYLAVQVNNNVVKLDSEKLMQLDPGTKRDIYKSLNKEITIEEAEDLMNS